MTNNVSRLVYLHMATPQLQAMTNYYHTILGYFITHETDEHVHLTNGPDYHNIVLSAGEKAEVLSYGYQLASHVTLAQYSTYLTEQNIAHAIKEQPLAGVEAAIELQDPAGNTVQLFEAIAHSQQPFTTAGIAPYKLGHVAFFSPNVKETVDFYERVLQFHFTDMIAGGLANFLTCNYEHHVINIVDMPRTGVHHIAFQLKDATHHFNSADLLARANIPVLWGPSRHTAGHNIAAYHKDPDGNIIELYTDMDVYVPEHGIFEPRPWHEEIPLKPRNWEGLSSWGTNFAFDLVTGK